MSSAINGANALGATLKHMTAAVLTALRLALLVSVNNLEGAREVLRDRRTALSTAVEAGRTFAVLARDILKPFLGSQYSEAWDAAGFRGSLSVPISREDVLRLLESLQAFFTSHPAMEWPDRNITAIQAGVLLDAINAANDAVLDQRSAVDILMSDRDEKLEAMRKGLRDLINELATIMDPLDARWLTFGFNKPGADETPDVPTGLSAVLVGPTAAATKWDASARAGYYRVWMKIHGSDAQPTPMGSPADLDFTLENLPANATVDIAVSAVNNGGESALSEFISVTTH